MIRVLHLNSLGYGGAAMAARRLHQGLVEYGYDSRLLIQEPGVEEEDSWTHTLDPETYGSPSEPHLDGLLESLYISSRAPGVDVLFSTDRPTRDIVRHPLFAWADVIHLHWVARMVSAEDVAALQRLDKPLIWTLHDQAPFTGGCHYSASCHQYQTDCSDCPLLQPLARALPELVLARKRRHIDPSNLTVVAPSRWLATEAAKSALFREADVRVIPYGLRVSDYRRVSRSTARTLLGLPADALVILFGASSLMETRKGYAHFEAAIERLWSHPAVGPLLANGAVVCASVGAGAPPSSTAFPVRHLGELSSSSIGAAYRAADLFVLPSLEDNLPNTLLEAVAAGTPVVGYATGGIPDVLADGGCGAAVESGDIQALASAIARLALDQAERRRLREHCEAYADTHLSLDIQAGEYARLYRERITARTKTPSAPATQEKSDVSSVAIRTLTSVAMGLQAECESLRTSAGQAASALRAGFEEWQATKESLQRQIASMAGRAAERAALESRARRMRSRGLPDPLVTLSSRDFVEPTALRVGVFGTGTAAMKVWEALVAIETVDTVWFADNDPVQHGRALLWIEVIAPADIPSRDYDAIVIGSLSLHAIRDQLLAMGIDACRILTPDVEGSVADIEAQLIPLLRVLEREREVA